MKRSLQYFRAGLLLLLAMLTCGAVTAQPSGDDLQTFIDQAASRQQTRADGDGFVEVDLSAFQAVERLTTLQIPSGKYRFINGSLTKSTSLTGPMVHASGGSFVEVGKGANFGTQMGGVVNGAPMVMLDNAHLIVASGGNICAGYLQGGKFDDVVWMSNSADGFSLDGGWIDGAIVCQVINASIHLNSGSVHTRGADFGNIYAYSDVHTTGDFWLHVDLQGKDNVVWLGSELKFPMEISGGEKTLGDAIVRGSVAGSQPGYTLTETDLSNVSFSSRRYTIELQNNAIVLAEGDDLQQYINSLQPGAMSAVDLSQFKAVTRTKTLLVSGGRQVRFTNGTLDRAASLNAPVLLIDGDSQVEVAAEAAITGQGHITDDDACEVVRLNNGSLRITGGYVEGACEVRQFTGNVAYLGGPGHDPAIALTSTKDQLILDGGTIYGNITCSVSGAAILLNSGKLSGTRFGSTSQASRQPSGAKKMPAAGTYEPMIDTYSDVHVKNVTPYSFNWGLFDTEFQLSSIDVTLHGKATAVYQQATIQGGLRITAPDKVNNDVLVYGENYLLTDEDGLLVSYVGDSKYKVVKETNKIYLYYDDLQDFLDNPGEGNGTEDDPYKTKVPCNGVNVNNGLKFPEDDLQWFITGKPEVSQTTEETDTCQGAVRQNDGDIVVSPGSTVTFTHLYFWGCGCKNYVYVWGTLIIDYNIYIHNYLRFIYLRPGGRVIIRGLNGTVTEEVVYVDGGTIEYRGGDVTGGTYGWYNTGGIIYIYDGTIRGGTCGGYTGVKGTTYIYGGTIFGGFVNYGTTYWHGGTVTGVCPIGGAGHTIYNYQGGTIYIYGGTCSGPGSIWSQGVIYLDGGSNVSVNDIYVILGCRIYIISKLTYVLRLHITIENVILDTPIILGGEGYTLTADDCSHLQIELPEGYEWHFDEAAGGVVITKVDAAVNAIKADGSPKVQVHDLQGRRADRTVSGQVYTREGKKYMAK